MNIAAIRTARWVVAFPWVRLKTEYGPIMRRERVGGRNVNRRKSRVACGEPSVSGLR
jgi:hypothetical protein